MTLPLEALDLLWWLAPGTLLGWAEFTLYFICLQGMLRCGVLFNNVKCYPVEERVQRCIF